LKQGYSPPTKAPGPPNIHTMKYATVEDVISSFPHQMLPSVTGEPDYHTLRSIRKMLRENARHIDTHAGGGHLDISVSSYQTLLIPQVRQARKYPNSPWETIHPPGKIMQYVLDPTRATRLGVPSHSQPLINTKYQIQVTNYLQTIF
jgi:hypothetical protein